jgi:hypothetical protein
MLEQIKLLGMTAVLTILVWATADRLVNETIAIDLICEFTPVPDMPDLLVSPVQNTAFKVEMSGPRRLIDQASKSTKVKLQINDRPTGVSTVNVKQLLDDQWREHPKLSLLSVTPATAEVRVDHRARAEVQVVLRPPRLLFDQPPRLDRSQVTVEMRESVYAPLRDAGRKLQVEVDVDRAFRGQPAGRPLTLSVPLTPDVETFGPDARFTPNEVKVTGTLAADRKSADITTCPIQIAVGFAHFGRRYRIEDDRGPVTLVTRTITVTGPVEAVDRLLAGDRPVGIIRLRAEDFDRAGVQRSFVPEFHLPPGVELAREPEPVLLKLVEEP